MTGTIISGLRKPRKDFEPTESLPKNLYSTDNLDNYKLQWQKMTSASQHGQIQLTPLWEHVVRTRKFPSNTDIQSTFDEISERLNDPEWEVRQHALRVLIDVLPTLEIDVIDKSMKSVLPELVKNLGNFAPAVRKGSLDALRVYLLHSIDRDTMIRNILQEGLNRPDALDNFQNNISMGVILSTPLLLFPSKGIPPPSVQVLKEATQALASHLIQVTHQEAALKSLIKIRETVGVREFDSYLQDIDNKIKCDFETLCDVYKVKLIDKNKQTDEEIKKSSSDTLYKRNIFNTHGDIKKALDQNCVKDQFSMKDTCESDSDTSGVVEEDEEVLSGSTAPARIVLETEIKFNEETAITMTVLEEKGQDSDDSDEESDAEEEHGDCSLEQDLSLEELRKTPRRVHFGGEVVKLRTPDSDDTASSVQKMPKTRIPIPISPATKMPKADLRPRPSSQPCSPSRNRQLVKRPHRSHSSSPRREVYVHNANLSPKKGILTRSNSPLFGIEPVEPRQGTGRRRSPKKTRSDSIDLLAKKRMEGNGFTEVDIRQSEKKAFHVCPDLETEHQIKEEVSLTESLQEVAPTSSKKNEELISEASRFIEDERNNRSLRRRSVVLTNGDLNSVGALESNSINETRSNSINSINSGSKESLESKETDSKYIGSKDSSPSRGSPYRRRSSSFEVFPRQERNYILMELSSPIKHSNQNKESPQSSLSTLGSVIRNDNGSDLDDKISAVAESKDNRAADIVNPINEGKPVEGDVKEEIVSSEKIEEDDAILEKKEISNGVESAAGEYKSKDVSSKKVSRKVCESSRLEMDKDSKCKEPNWEELGLVDQDVLNDLHNKDDWRARVRALERIASVLRISSALITIEQRLGSLLHTVLGGERSCKVAAAGLGVARVVLTGVSEDALKRRLSLIAWGLARQGGSNAAQLARIAMLRLRPSLFLEHLMQTQCIGARNAKTRENTLQLLIFSLVTFPSTEFNVNTLANKVVNIVGDRRRRVRQAALDTLAVLAQIYEAEDILQAGKQAAKDRHDGAAMIAAIRARLARKSLPMVSADGLVVYGLQISPTAQITTGPDVDWIVAGSGSVSPGTGRTRGQIIATTKMEISRTKRNESAQNRENRWADSPKTLAIVGGLNNKNEHSTGSWRKDDCGLQNKIWKNEGNKASEVANGSARTFDSDQRLEVQLRELCSAPGKINEALVNKSSDTKNIEDLHSQEIESKSKDCITQIDAACGEKIRMSSAPPQERTLTNGESKIPILNSRGSDMKETSSVHKQKIRAEKISQIHEKSHCNVINEKPSKVYSGRSSGTGINESESKRFGNLYQHRKHLIATSSIQVQTQPLASYTVNYCFNPNSNNYLLPSQVNPSSQNGNIIKSKNNVNQQKTSSQNKHRSSDSQTNSYSSTNDREKIPAGTPGATKFSRRVLKSAPHRQTSVQDSYSSIYQRQLRYHEENPFQNLQSRTGSLRQIDYDSNNRSTLFGNDLLSKQSIKEKGSKVISSPIGSAKKAREIQTENQFPNKDNLRARSSLETLPSDIYNSPYKRDKGVVDEEEYNNINRRRFSSQTIIYPEQNQDEETQTQNQVRNSTRTNSASSAVSNFSVGREHHENLENFYHDQIGTTNCSNKNSRASSPSIQAENKAFDVITEQKNPSRRSSFDYIISSKQSPLPMKADDINIDEDTDKELSIEDEEDILRRQKKSIIESENENRSVNESEDTSEEEIIARNIVRTKSDSSILSVESALTIRTSVLTNFSLPSSQSLKELNEACFIPSMSNTSDSNKPDSIFSNQSVTNNSILSRNSASSLDRVCSPKKKWGEVGSFESLDFRNSCIENTNSVAILATSRPRTPESSECDNGLRIVDSNITLYNSDNMQLSSKSSISQRFIPDTLSEKHDSSPSTGSEEPVESSGSENNASANLHCEPIPSRHRLDSLRQTTKTKTKLRGNIARVVPMPVNRNSEKDKAKSNMQQCFIQLESKDWEVIMKGLHTLSLIAKQTPGQLDSCTPGMIVRLLGRHVQNLRSQVSRAACLAAGDIFCLHIRRIDKDLDDLAGPLLIRTADTNKFLRADSNAALDRFIEHLPPHRTIGIIVNRGATHQNAIVRATTARLLSAIVDRVGPDHIMMLPRDARDKLFSTGAKLLIDGNLNARNHAKEIFRRLTRCEGFRKALTESVPETTLRHIEKTLKSL